MRVAVVSDSGSGMTLEQGKDTGIYVLPLQISVNGKAEFEGETIFVDEVYELVARGEDVKTSMPSLGRIEALFNELKDNYDHILAIPICRGLSGTIDAMEMVAKEVGIPFDYVDCHTTFSNQLYLAQAARTLLDDGKSVEEVKERLLASVQDSITMIIPNDLMHLAKSGRITSAVAILGGLLKIKPILYLNKNTEGKIDSYAKIRTMHKAMETCVELLKKKELNEDYLLTVGHVADNELGNYFYTMIRNEFPKNEVLYHQIASVVGVHTGVGCVGLQYIKRVNMD